jgi:hypothetical protein
MKSLATKARLLLVAVAALGGAMAVSAQTSPAEAGFAVRVGFGPYYARPYYGYYARPYYRPVVVRRYAYPYRYYRPRVVIAPRRVIVGPRVVVGRPYYARPYGVRVVRRYW